MGDGSHIWATWVSYDRKNSSTCLRWLASFSGEEGPNTYPISPAICEDAWAERFCFQGFIVRDKFGTQREHAHSYHKCYRNFSPSSCFNTSLHRWLAFIECLLHTRCKSKHCLHIHWFFLIVVKWTQHEIYHIRPF